LCHARNAGWKIGRGDYVAYLDDDAVAHAGWMSAVLQAFHAHPEAGIVGGRVDPIWEAQRPTWLSDEIALSLTILNWSKTLKIIQDPRSEWLVGANLALPRRVLGEVGGFNPALDRVGKRMLSSGDVLLQTEVMRRGYTCIYHPGMAVSHRVPASRLTKHWFRQRYFWQGVSDAAMEMVLDPSSRSRRMARAFRRGAKVATSIQTLRALSSQKDDPISFTRHCLALIEIGHVAGLLGAVRE
jgi:glucosyl-dolichyl phosphate glucuronosyltransferase